MKTDRKINNASKFYKHYKSDVWLNYLDVDKNIYTSQVFKLLNPKFGELILDNCCGSGRYSFAIQDKRAVVVSLDISIHLIQSLKETSVRASKFNELNLLIGDCQKLPFRNNKFDKVLCTGNLWYIPFYEEATYEMIRTTKKHGKIYVDQISKKFYNSYISILKTIFYGMIEIGKSLLTLIHFQIPLYYRMPEQFLNILGNYTLNLYSLSSPSLLYLIIQYIPPLNSLLYTLKPRLWPVVLTEGFDFSGHLWFAILTKKLRSKSDVE